MNSSSTEIGLMVTFKQLWCLHCDKRRWHEILLDLAQCKVCAVVKADSDAPAEAMVIEHFVD